MDTPSWRKLPHAVALCAWAVLVCRTAGAQSGNDCARATTQAAATACAGHRYAAADKRLTSLYIQAAAALAPPQRAALAQSQREWARFRDDDARVYELLYRGGSMAALAVLTCKTEATRARIAQLRVLLEQAKR